MPKLLHSRCAGLMAGALLLSAALAPQVAAKKVSGFALFVSSTNTKSVIAYDGETGAYLHKFARGGGLIEPEGLAFGPDGNLYVASRSDEILRYDGEKGNFKGVFASGNGLVDPAGIAFGPDGDLFVAAGLLEGGDGGNKILRFDGATGAFVAELDPDNSAGLTDPEALVFGPDGLLYVSDTPEVGNGPVLRYDPATNDFHSTFIPAADSIPDPTGMVFGPDGNLYLSSAATSEVRRYNGTTGAPLGVFIAPEFCGLNEAEGMVFLPDGHLLVASELSDEVIEFSSTGACLGPFVTAGSGKLSEPTFMTLGPPDSEAENDAFRFRKVP